MIAVSLSTVLYAVITLDRGNYASAPWITRSTAVFILCATLIPMLVEGMHHILDPLNPKNLFLFTFALQFGLYPLFILNGGARIPLFGFAASSGVERHYVETQLLAVLGLLCYLLGYSSRLARSMERLLPRPLPFAPDRVKTISLVLFLAGYLGAAALFSKEGGLSQFLTNREQWRAGGMTGSGIFLMPADLWLPLAALLPMMQLARKQESGAKLAARLGFLALCLVPVFFIGFRTLIVTPILQWLAIFHYLRHRVSILRTLSLGVIVVALMTLYGLSRVAGLLTLETIEAVGPQASLEYVFFRTPGTDAVATILSSCTPADFEFGVSSAVEAVTIVVPRWVWHNKPLSWGERTSTRFFGDYFYMTGYVRETYGGVNPTAIGYLYLQFGWPSVALGMFLIGASSKMIYTYGLRFAGANTAFLLYILLWPLPIMVAEGPPNAFNQLMITVLCAWLPLSYLATRQSTRENG